MLDPYCYPNTTILRNKLGIQDAADLAVFEGEAVALALSLLKTKPLRTPFLLPRLQETHRRIFGDIYPWAGQLRQNTGAMGKKRDAGNTVIYGDSAHVPAALAALFAQLEREAFLRQTPAATMPQRLAHFYGELDAIHPFREGNSRTLRQFFADLARNAGYLLDWTAASDSPEKRTALIAARDRAVMQADSSAMAEILRTNLILLNPSARSSGNDGASIP